MKLNVNYYKSNVYEYMYLDFGLTFITSGGHVLEALAPLIHVETSALTNGGPLVRSCVSAFVSSGADEVLGAPQEEALVLT